MLAGRLEGNSARKKRWPTSRSVDVVRPAVVRWQAARSSLLLPHGALDSVGEQMESRESIDQRAGSGQEVDPTRLALYSNTPNVHRVAGRISWWL